MLHLIVPFYRKENLNFYLENIRDKNIMFEFLVQEDIQIDLSNVNIYNIPIHSVIRYPDAYKHNNFVSKFKDKIIDDDWYGFMNDDDWFEKGIETIANIEGDVIFVSMKRGNRIPKDPDPRSSPHGISTLVADPKNVKIGRIGIEQIFIKGRILKNTIFRIHPTFDGFLAMELKEKYNVIYKRDLYVLFNYLQKGRWN